PACLDALVTEDAFRVVANVELVVDLDRLPHGGRRARFWCFVMTGASPIAGTPRAEGRWSIALRAHLVFLHPPLDLGRRERHVGGRRQELEHHPAAVPDPLRAGL